MKVIGALTWIAVFACVGSAQTGGPRQALEKAAGALGGIDRIRSVKNIRLIGYGQYSYMMGGGNISGDPHAPQKFEAANALERVIDLENNRYQHVDRRNFLFPFAVPFGHDFHLNDERLDGDIAYDAPPNGAPRRVNRWAGGATRADGVHMRRMWMLNNPVAAVRAALEPGSKVSAAKKDSNLSVFDVVIKEGDRFQLAIDPASNLPAWIRWSNPQGNLGQVTMTTHYTGYTPHKGLLMPLGYQTNLDWRNVPYQKLYVDAYKVDEKTPDLAAPAAVREAVEREPVYNIVAKPITKGIWRLSNGTTVFEFEDHLLLYELNGGQPQALAVIEAARKLVPGKPVTQFIASHNHFDHSAGLRMAVAEGLEVIARRGNEAFFRELVSRPAPDFPDKLERIRSR